MKNPSAADKSKYCILDEEKICDDCGECDRCDLDPNKICDNCCHCIDTDTDYGEIEIDGIYTDIESIEQIEEKES
ncbi:Uncharacterised protein [uncultured Clostridium sp.]|nr:Uncharacterised protein [uncultured Clostridium sp.]